MSSRASLWCSSSVPSSLCPSLWFVERRATTAQTAAVSMHERPHDPCRGDSRSGTSYGEPTSQRRGPERPIGFCRTQPPRHATVVKRDGVGFHRDCIPPPPAYPQVSAPAVRPARWSGTPTSVRIPHKPRTRPIRFTRVCAGHRPAAPEPDDRQNRAVFDTPTRYKKRASDHVSAGQRPSHARGGR